MHTAKAKANEKVNRFASAVVIVCVCIVVVTVLLRNQVSFGSIKQIVSNVNLLVLFSTYSSSSSFYFFRFLLFSIHLFFFTHYFNLCSVSLCLPIGILVPTVFPLIHTSHEQNTKFFCSL